MKVHHNYDLQDLREKDRRHAVHGWTDFSKFGEQGSEILFEADGLYVTDLEGRSFMDAMAGVWCVNIGYGPFISPHMTQSIFDAISVFISTACVVSALDRG